MRLYKKLLTISLFATVLTVGCKKLDTIIENPNSVDPSLANVDLLLNGVQQNFVSVFNNLSDFGQEVTRQQAMTGGPLYNNAYTPPSFDGTWTTAYTGVIKNANAVIPLALQQKKYLQAGIAQVFKAYVLGSMVDFFGDVPDKDAALGQDNLNPKADAGAEVYKTVFTLLDSAIANFNKPTAPGVAGPPNDLFYQGSKAKWGTAAKTLKLKFLLQTRLIDNTVTAKAQSLITENDFIKADANDFQFKYGTTNISPDSRHPHYSNNYRPASVASANDFIGSYFMWAVGVEKSGSGAVTSLDPRRRYYFYRQRTNNADANSSTCPCVVQPRPGHYTPEQPFCLVGAGYWGRDHGDNSGVPPDGTLRTTWGVYPAGGDYDASQGTSVNNTRGGRGAGINPIFMSAFTYFVEAEAALKLNITSAGTPKSFLEKGVRASIAKVLGFPATVNVVVATPPSAAAIETYVTTVLDRYDAATTDAARLDVIIKEYYIATWGNGIEPYNNYRRTGSPNNMQLTVTTANSGLFIRSFFYPTVYIERNINAPKQKNPGVMANKVFWDNNADNFIK